MLIRLLFISFLFLLSCNNNDSKSSGGGQASPNFKLDLKSKALSAKPITPQLKERAAQFFKSGSSINLLIKSAFDNYDNEVEKNQILQSLNDNDKSHLSEINKFCIIKAWTRSKESLFTEKVPSRERSISANKNPKCPLSRIEKEQELRNLTEEQAKEGILVGTARTDKSEEVIFLNESLKKSLNISSLKSYEVAEHEYNNAKFSGGPKLDAGTAFQSIKRTTETTLYDSHFVVSESSQIEVIMTAQNFKLQGLVTFSFPEGEFVYYGEGNGTDFHFIINGESYTREQISKEFGITFN